ncbi:Cu(I)/Ag(I) efflux system membrane protein CusA/SilA [Sinobacterium caligoides]|uniref:Cu(I)/Ag(I) efflux system membrane protein CusA/SilA n=1 Tax=Sinobacterium caligoides TaxID=933926 RepID=A0A3N2DZE2_9GAMM|nr:CusA/CzcA family heavy metal efflux RND transporter [Sinobacterium caligoides]ROS05012.1 Cu(I)/Ag(I) efflux system membrane protein CusA/SilA [Sinobacterium caligoides]
MIEAIIRWSVVNRFMVLLATACLIVVGGYALKHTPVDALPDLSDVQVIVKTSYPGQAPQVVQDQVTYPLTTAMLSVPKAKTVRGFSFYGDSYVYVIFEEGTDMYWARSRVLEYLSQISAKLPAQAKAELGPDATGVGWVYEYALVDRSGRHDLAQLRSLQDWFLKFELQAVSGVSEVSTIGGMVKQYQVVVDPNKLRAYGLPLSLITTAIQQANHESGASVIEMAEAEYMVRVTGYLQSVTDIENVPLGASEEGTPILLKQVARVVEGPQMRRGIAELNGEGEVVGGVVVMRSGENAQQTIAAVKQRLASLAKGLPQGVEVVEVYNRATLVQSALDNLRSKLLEEFIVVALVCALFLFHFRSALIVIISLPIGILVAVSVMYWQGINANIMSLGGIAIAIGAMVDGAIVMIENVHKKLAACDDLSDKQRWQLVLESSIEVGPPLFYSLLIITVSFLPVFALEAQEGKMFAPLAYTKTFAMAASAGLAITLIPVLMGYLIRGKVHSEAKNPVNRLLMAAYRPLLTWFLRRPVKTLLVAMILTVAGLWPMTQLGSEFMPELDEGDLMYMPTTYAAVSIGKARQILQQTDKLIKTVPEVKTVFGKVGRAESATDPAPLTMIETVIQFKPKEQWRPGVSKQDIKEELNRLVDIPGLSNAWVMPIKTRIDMLATGIKTPVGIKIAGADLSVIESIAKQLEAILPAVEGTASVYAERVVGGRYITVDIDRQRASRYGLNIADIQQVVSTAIGGVNVTETTEGQERFPVNVRYPQRYRDSAEQLRWLPIVTKSGGSIALSDVAAVRVSEGPPAIKSENARLNGWVLIDIEGRDLGSYVAEAKARVLQQLQLPAGYSIHWSGQYEYMERAKAKLTVVVPVTLLLIMALLIVNFRSVTEVLIIMISLPFAMVGGILYLYLAGYQLSVAVGVGFIALAGVSVEIGVLMLVYLNQALQEYRAQFGEPDQQGLAQLVGDTAALRVRPIVMTAITVIVGLVPVMMGEGTGSEVMQRIAAPMVGGMVTSLLLTLVVLPCLYFCWRRSGLPNEESAGESVVKNDLEER